MTGPFFSNFTLQGYVKPTMTQASYTPIKPSEIQFVQCTQLNRAMYSFHIKRRAGPALNLDCFEFVIPGPDFLMEITLSLFSQFVEVERFNNGAALYSQLGNLLLFLYFERERGFCVKHSAQVGNVRGTFLIDCCLRCCNELVLSFPWTLIEL